MDILQSFFKEISFNPIISCLILIISWIWIKLYLEEWNLHHFTISYSEFIQKKQYWRIILSPISHKSLFHLLLNIMVLWNCRTIETSYGSLYFLKYSMVLIVFESLLSFFIMYLTITYICRDNLLLLQLVSKSSTIGCSGLCLSWLAYQSIDFMNNESSRMFLLFGFISFEPYLAPIIMISIYMIYLPKNHFCYHISALIGGYLLVSGPLQCLPDLYWTLCFFVDITLVVTFSILLENENVYLNNENENSDESNSGQSNLLDVIDFNIGGGLNSESRTNSITTTHTEEGTTRRRSTDYTENSISLSEFQRIQEEEDLEEGLLHTAN